MAAYSEDRKRQIEANSRLVKSNMKRLGVSSIEIAKHLGITAPAISQTLSSDIPLTLLQTIADYCGCTVNDLVYEYKEENTDVFPEGEEISAKVVRNGKEISIRIE